MRVAFFVHCFYPSHFYGTEAYTLMLAKQFREFGHESVVVTATFPGEPKQESLVHLREWEGIPVYSIDKNAFGHRSVRDTYDQPDLRFVHERILRRIAPDVVHVCHLINHTTSVLDVAAAMNIPTYMTLTDFFGFCLNNKLEAANGSLCAGPSPSRDNCIACHIKDVAASPNAPPRFRYFNAEMVRPLAAHALALGYGGSVARKCAGFAAADIVERPDRLRRAMAAVRGAIAPSAFLKQSYANNNFPAPLKLSHFGVEINRARKPPPPDPAIVRLAFVGQIAAHKGVHILIEALRMAGRRTLCLDIWGPDNQDVRYYEQLRRSASGLSVRFRGVFPSAQTAEVLAEIDVLVIPSTWYENSPMILLQALATHTPVIVSDVLGMTEFVAEGTMGFHFARGDAGELAKILARFGDDPELARRLGDTTAYTRTPAEMARGVEELIGNSQGAI